MSKGWISLHRSLLNHWIYEDAEYLKIWITFLLEATHKKHRQLVGNQSIELNVGQFVFGRKRFAERLKIKEWKLQKAIELFVKDEMIKTVKRANKYTIYEIVNYSLYQQQVQQQVQQQEMPINQGVSQIEHQQNNSKNDSKSNSKNDSKNDSNKARNIKDSIYFINSKNNNKASAKHQQQRQQEQQQQSLIYQGFEAYEQQQEHQQMFEISTHNNNNNNNNIYNAAANEVDSVISFYINSLSDYNPNNIQAIESYMDDMQPALVKKAIEIAVKRNKRFYKYVKGILENWLSKGIKTIEEYEREELYKPQQQEENFGGPYVPNAEETRKMLDELLRGMRYESAAP